MLDSRNIGNWEWLWFLQLFPGSYILQCGSTLALRDWICCIIINWDLWLIPLQVFECRSERFSTPEWRSIWGTRLVSVCLIQPAWLELILVLVQLAWISAPFATIWLSRRSGLAWLSSHLQIEIWKSLDHVIWHRLIVPHFGPISFEIQNWGTQASPRHKQEIRTHEFLASHSLLILWTKSDSYLIRETGSRQVLTL